LRCYETCPKPPLLLQLCLFGDGQDKGTTTRTGIGKNGLEGHRYRPYHQGVRCFSEKLRIRARDCHCSMLLADRPVNTCARVNNLSRIVCFLVSNSHSPTFCSPLLPPSFFHALRVKKMWYCTCISLSGVSGLYNQKRGLWELRSFLLA
jgi:hypothetical protein